MLLRAVSVIENAGGNEEDQDEIFGKFVASEMRVINNPQAKIRVKRIIQNTICDAQCNLISSSGSDNYGSGYPSNFNPVLSGQHMSFYIGQPSYHESVSCAMTSDVESCPTYTQLK